MGLRATLLAWGVAAVAGLALPLSAAGQTTVQSALIYADLSPDGRESLVGSIPLKRMGQPEEVAEAILWLLSGQASYVTGSILSVNGGR